MPGTLVGLGDSSLSKNNKIPFFLEFTLQLGYKTINRLSKIHGMLYVCVCMFSCSVMSRLFVTLWTIARQAPLSMEFSRQEYWSGLSFPSPGALPDPY